MNVEANHDRQFVWLIITYRWLSLAPPLLLLFSDVGKFWLLGLGVVSTGIITGFRHQINQLAAKKPYLLLIDLLFISFLIAQSGGWQSPYYLLALSPLMFAAYFLTLRQLVAMTIALWMLFTLAVFSVEGSPNITIYTIESVGLFTISGAFEYMTRLILQLSVTHQELASTQTMLKSSAIQKERMRIARDMHDTISQSLFGITFAINGCRKLLQSSPELVADELKLLEMETQTVRSELRQIIFDLWPGELTAEQFSADISRYLLELTDQPIELEFDVKGDFSTLPPFTRRSLYRICQEALANMAKYAEADHARICFDILNNRARLLIRDNGIGFNPLNLPNEDDATQKFGIRGMEERSKSLGGTFDIFSRPNEGTSIIVDVPIS